jgi:hypothetical protein
MKFALPFDPRLAGEDNSSRSSGVYREMLLAVEGEEIRAGLLLQHGRIWVERREQSFCWLGLPVSEGLVNPRYGMAILPLITWVLAQHPLLMSIGVGGMEEVYARFLIQLGWRHATVPFCFHPVRLTRMLRSMPYLRRRRSLDLGARLLAFSGVAAVGSGALASVRWLRRSRLSRCEVSRETGFGAWTDRVYDQARGAYGATVVRDAATLNALYPPDDSRYVRLRLRARPNGEELGWLVVVHARMRQNRYFGDLHVGTLVDGFGKPEHIPALVAAGLQFLTEQGVDLVVANWSHRAWVRASRGAGFLPGPSNYFWFVSPEGNPLLLPVCPLPEVHLNRGDGDGPFSLIGEPALPP